MENTDFFKLALPNLQKEFKDYQSIDDVAQDYYSIDKVVSSFFIVFDVDHPEYDNKVTNLEMEFGASDILYNLPEEGHSFVAENFQDRLFLFDCEVSVDQISNIVRNVAVVIEKVNPDSIIS
tara:strand:+ start:79 stop:444 length:366 start_codon:yes stop_codon:yes gene_type:complete